MAPPARAKRDLVLVVPGGGGTGLGWGSPGARRGGVWRGISVRGGVANPRLFSGLRTTVHLFHLLICLQCIPVKGRRLLLPSPERICYGPETEGGVKAAGSVCPLLSPGKGPNARRRSPRVA